MKQNNSRILDPVCYSPGFVTKYGEYAAIPYGEKYMILHEGKQVKICNTIETAEKYVNRQMKLLKKSQSGKLPIE